MNDHDGAQTPAELDAIYGPHVEMFHRPADDALGRSIWTHRVRLLRAGAIFLIVLLGAMAAKAVAAPSSPQPPADPVLRDAAIRATVARADLWLWRDFDASGPASVTCSRPPASAGGWWAKAGGSCVVTIQIGDDAGRAPLTVEMVQVRATRPGCPRPAYRPATGGWRYPLRPSICLRGTESQEGRQTRVKRKLKTTGGGGSGARSAIQHVAPRVAWRYVGTVDGDTIKVKRAGHKRNVRRYAIRNYD